jgi:hypothetical protein
MTKREEKYIGKQMLLKPFTIPFDFNIDDGNIFTDMFNFGRAVQRDYINDKGEAVTERVTPREPMFWGVVNNNLDVVAGEPVTVTFKMPDPIPAPDYYKAVIDGNSMTTIKEVTRWKLKELIPVYYTKPNIKKCRKIFSKLPQTS